MVLDDKGDTCNVYLYLMHAYRQLYSMIRDPKTDNILEHTVTEEVATGKAAESNQNGGLRADK
jgi:hypothetical protein